MNRPHIARWLWITWTVLCALACVLLVALWVRSYWRMDSLSGPAIICSDFLVQSVEGLFFASVNPSGQYDHLEFGSAVLTEPFKPEHFFQLGSNPHQGQYIGVPHWFAVLLSASLAVLPWVRSRFSLRSLLIATTLVAVGLGLIVWLR